MLPTKDAGRVSLQILGLRKYHNGWKEVGSKRGHIDIPYVASDLRRTVSVDCRLSEKPASSRPVRDSYLVSPLGSVGEGRPDVSLPCCEEDGF